MVLGWGKKVENQQDNEEEMSMEEILASIRKYVSTDQQAPQSAPQPVMQPQQGSASSTPYGYQPTQPEIASHHMGMGPEEEISPYKTERTNDKGFTTPSLKAAPQSSSAFGDTYADSTYNQIQDPRQDLRQEIPPSVLEHPVTASMASRFNTESIDLNRHEGETAMGTNSGLLSSGTMTATSQAFSKLLEASRPMPEKVSATPAALTLDQLIADLARPMIKTWVDQNLSKLVETMVSQEIEKITKNLR